MFPLSKSNWIIDSNLHGLFTPAVKRLVLWIKVQSKDLSMEEECTILTLQSRKGRSAENQEDALYLLKTKLKPERPTNKQQSITKEETHHLVTSLPAKDLQIGINKYVFLRHWAETTLHQNGNLGLLLNPWITAEGLHFNYFKVVSFQIKCGGTQNPNHEDGVTVRVFLDLCCLHHGGVEMWHT